MWRNLYKLIIIFLCFIKFLRFDGNLCQLIDNHSSDRRTVICHQENLFCFIITTNLCINISGFHQCVDITDLSPVDTVSNFSSFCILLLRHQIFYFI